MDFTYNIRRAEDMLIFDFKGCTLDKSHSNGLLKEIDQELEAGNIKMIVNLAGIDYMNSSGLNLMINMLTKCRNHNGELIICNIPTKVKKLLVVSKLTSVFDIEDSEKAAIEKLRQV